eukprot:6339465-Prymnesium_polylepis.1
MSPPPPPPPPSDAGARCSSDNLSLESAERVDAAQGRRLSELRLRTHKAPLHYVALEFAITVQ